MNDLVTVRRRRAAEVVLLDERDREAAEHRVARDRYAVNAAAHDRDVETAVGQLTEISLHPMPTCVRSRATPWPLRTRVPSPRRPLRSNASTRAGRRFERWLRLAQGRAAPRE